MGPQLLSGGHNGGLGGFEPVPNWVVEAPNGCAVETLYRTINRASFTRHWAAGRRARRLQGADTQPRDRGTCCATNTRDPRPRHGATSAQNDLLPRALVGAAHPHKALEERFSRQDNRAFGSWQSAPGERVSPPRSVVPGRRVNGSVYAHGCGDLLVLRPRVQEGARPSSWTNDERPWLTIVTWVEAPPEAVPARSRELTSIADKSIINPRCASGLNARISRACNGPRIDRRGCGDCRPVNWQPIEFKAGRLA